MTDLLNMFEDLDRNAEQRTRETILRAPFKYPGGKSRSIDKILPRLPYRGVYVEPFGGSAAILLARHPSKLEVFNDRYAGVVAFYRCLRDPSRMTKLCEAIELTVHSREDFIINRDWQNPDDDVERAFRWYYMTEYSFAGLGRNFGRSTSARARLVSIRDKLPLFPKIHDRFKRVQVENQDWYDCIIDYDSPDTVFYIDPPYIDADTGIYKSKMTHDDHRHLLDVIIHLQGFVAVSGYSNPIYENQDWDNRHEWESYVSIQSQAYTETNFKAHLKGMDKRSTAKEVLWVKE